MAEPIDDVLAELRAFLNDATATESFALGGIRRILAELNRQPRHPENPDPMVYSGAGDPNDPATLLPHAGLRLSNALAQAAPGGPFETRLGQQWIVYVYAAWDERFRKRIAEAQGLSDARDLKVPVFGDLRRLRHDVVHNQGIASKEYTGKCEVLPNWFSPGETITLEPGHFVEFNGAVPWEELRTLGT